MTAGLKFQKLQPQRNSRETITSLRTIKCHASMLGKSREVVFEQHHWWRNITSRHHKDRFTGHTAPPPHSELLKITTSLWLPPNCPGIELPADSLLSGTTTWWPSDTIRGPWPGETGSWSPAFRPRSPHIFFGRHRNWRELSTWRWRALEGSL